MVFASFCILDSSEQQDLVMLSTVNMTSFMSLPGKGGNCCSRHVPGRQNLLSDYIVRFDLKSSRSLRLQSAVFFGGWWGRCLGRIKRITTWIKKVRKQHFVVPEASEHRARRLQSRWTQTAKRNFIAMRTTLVQATLWGQMQRWVLGVWSRKGRITAIWAMLRKQETGNLFTSLAGYDLRWNKLRETCFFSLIGGDDVL